MAPLVSLCGGGRAVPPRAGAGRSETKAPGRPKGRFPGSGGSPSPGEPPRAGPRTPPAGVQRVLLARELPTPAAEFAGLWESVVEGLLKSEVLFTGPYFNFFFFFSPTKRRETSRNMFFLYLISVKVYSRQGEIGLNEPSVCRAEVGGGGWLCSVQ